MAVSQRTYYERHNVAYEGQIASTHGTEIETYLADEDIGFGLAVVSAAYTARAAQAAALTAQKNELDRCKLPDDDLPAAATGIGVFLGVAVIDKTREPEAEDKYAKGAGVNVMSCGDVWVRVETAVVRRQKVIFFHTPGAAVANPRRIGGLGAGAVVAAKANNAQLATRVEGAVWLTSAAAGGYAKLRLPFFEASA